MLAKLLFTTVPGSIILASLIISTTILISGGNLKIKDTTAQKGSEVTVQTAQPYSAFKSAIDKQLSQI